MAAPLRRTEAKAFFANERTFLHWMNMSVTVGSISAALIGVAGHAHKHWSAEYEARSIFVRSVALVMLTSSIGMAVYATYNFRLRTLMLQYKQDGPYDNRLLPVLLAVVIMTALSLTFVGTIVSLTGS
jgi:uncharacterized membrane protein YidH (DUF202 family)